MGIDVYGHYGAPIVVFPTSGGDEREYAGQGSSKTTYWLSPTMPLALTLVIADRW
jgi:hypothetical protein